MSWLRLDDGFADHPKLRRLTVAQRWTWLELLLYCARHRTGGELPEDIKLDVPGATPAFLRRALELELLDRYVTEDVAGDVTEGYAVHDWSTYNKTLESSATRQRRYRMRKAGVPEETVLEEAPLALPDDIPFERYVTGDVSDDVTVDVSTRARYPVPSPKSFSTPTSTLSGEGLNPGKELAVARLLERLGSIPPEKVDIVRGLGARAPEAVTQRLLESIGTAGVRDRLAYVIGTYRQELGI